MAPHKPNQLLLELGLVQEKIKTFRQKARQYYFEVLLSAHSCPACGGKLIMADKSMAVCTACKINLDPTISFQKSPCCDSILKRRVSHYVCQACGMIVPSDFLFGEKLFDKNYFREMMQKARIRARQKRQELIRRLAEASSGSLLITEEPNLEKLPGFDQDLKDFIGADNDTQFEDLFANEFSMSQYRDHILNHLQQGCQTFSEIEPVLDDVRKDRAWRFVTLVFMQHSGEVILTQNGESIWVEAA